MVEEAGRTLLRLLPILLALAVANLQERQGLRVLGHEHVADVAGQSDDEVAPVEALRQHPVEEQHDVGHLVVQGQADGLEVVVGIEDVEVFDGLLEGDVALRETRHLVEDGERVAHTAIGLLRYHAQGLLLIGDFFAFGHHLQLLDDVGHGHSLEVVDLAAREDGGQDLVLLGRGEDEDDMGGRFLQRLEEGIEGLLREHVDLVDDKDLVAAHLRRDAGLLHELLDLIDTIVGRGIELEDVEGAALFESLATLAGATGLAVVGGVLAVDGLGEDARTSGLSHTARTAEEVGVGQFARLDRIAESGGQRVLADDVGKLHRTVFARRNYIFVHWLS